MTGIKKINLISAVLVSLSLCGGCTLEKAGNSSQDQAVQEDNETEQVKTEKAEKAEINEIHLRDKDSLYEMMMIPVLLPCILLYLREIHPKIHIIHGRKLTAILFMTTKIWEWRDIRWQDFCRWEMRMDR